MDTLQCPQITQSGRPSTIAAIGTALPSGERQKIFESCVSRPTITSRDLRKYAVGEASIQEAHMRRVLNILLVLGSIFVNVTATPNKTAAETEAQKTQLHNVILSSGLHISLPENLKNFSVDLVPLP